jgi:hypothetical protein
MFPCRAASPAFQYIASGRQKISFIPNWICLGVTFTFSELIEPKLPEPAHAPVGLVLLIEAEQPPFGGPNCGWFTKLYDSARNCSFTRSVIVKSLNSEASRLLIPGLRGPGVGEQVPNV